MSRLFMEHFLISIVFASHYLEGFDNMILIPSNIVIVGDSAENQIARLY